MSRIVLEIPDENAELIIEMLRHECKKWASDYRKYAAVNKRIEWPTSAADIAWAESFASVAKQLREQTT